MQGRKITKKQWEKFFERLIINGGNVSKTCEELKISRKAYYENVEKDSELMEKAKSTLRAIYMPMAEMVILLALGKGDATTARWVLQCLSSIWSPKEVRKLIHEIDQKLPEHDPIWDELLDEYEKKLAKYKRGADKKAHTRVGKRTKHKKRKRRTN